MNKWKTWKRDGIAIFSLAVAAVCLATEPGDLDFSFNPGAGANDEIWPMALQQDGKIVIAGSFTSINGTNRSRIARLNADGSLDTSFNPNAGANGDVAALQLQSDGKIIIGGDFTSVDGTTSGRVARLEANGSVDQTFNPGNGANNEVFAVAQQADGKVLIGGRFNSVSAQTHYHIARLNAQGSVETLFKPDIRGTETARVQAILVQPDHKILVGGYFDTINSISSKALGRLNEDGTFDSTFQTGIQIAIGPIYCVTAILLQPDGKVIAGGTFSGASRTNIARLNADGSVDSSFNCIVQGPGLAVCEIQHMALQKDGKIVVVGNFTNINGVAR